MKQKMRVLKPITTVNGTLYDNEIVTFENTEKNGDYRVRDTMGRIWFIGKQYLKEHSLDKENLKWKYGN